MGGEAHDALAHGDLDERPGIEKGPPAPNRSVEAIVETMDQRAVSVATARTHPIAEAKPAAPDALSMAPTPALGAVKSPPPMAVPVGSPAASGEGRVTLVSHGPSQTAPVAETVEDAESPETVDSIPEAPPESD